MLIAVILSLSMTVGMLIFSFYFQSCREAPAWYPAFLSDCRGDQYLFYSVDNRP